ncbi:MAG: hypothetical protein MJA30_11900, partial [Cytophagales bacterium]|nr:hypothetical protein [Cytophagales bacterium]
MGNEQALRRPSRAFTMNSTFSIARDSQGSKFESNSDLGEKNHPEKKRITSSKRTPTRSRNNSVFAPISKSFNKPKLDRAAGNSSYFGTDQTESFTEPQKLEQTNVNGSFHGSSFKFRRPRGKSFSQSISDFGKSMKTKINTNIAR